MTTLATVEGQHVIKGTVRNKDTNQPVSFASIAYKSNKGTAANEQGNFIIEIDTSFTQVEFRITCVGYKPMSFYLNKADLDRDHIFFLEENVIFLDEVEISNNRMSAKLLMDQVITKLTTNFPDQPYESDFFYRGSILKDSDYTCFIESVGEWHSEGFSLLHYSNKNHAFLNYYDYFIPKHTRAILNDPWPQFDSPKITRLPNLFNFYRAYKYLIPRSSRFHDYTIERIYKEEHQEIYVVQFKPKTISQLEHQLKKFERNPGFSLSEGKYYIDFTTKAIVQIDFKFTNQGINFSGLLKFMPVGNRLYKHYMKVETDFNHKKIHYYIAEEIFWSKFERSELDKRGLEQKFDMKVLSADAPMRGCQAAYINTISDLCLKYPGIEFRGLDWILYVPAYDHSFWAHHETPPNQAESKIMVDLMKFGKLEDQFRDDKFARFYEKQKEYRTIFNN